MRLKRILVIFIIGFLLMSVGCSKFGHKKGDSDNQSTNGSNESNQSNKKESKKKEEEIIIGLVTNEDGINGNGFNQSADMGAKLAEKELGLKYVPVESIKDKYKEGLEKAIDSNANLIFIIGNEMVDSVEKSSKEHKNKTFIVINNAIEGENIGSITFKEQEGSFLMGIIAGKMSVNNKVGFIGGKDISLINKYEAGFAAGVMSVNSEAGQYLLDRTYVKYTDSFKDISKGIEASKALYDSGCDVIYHMSGECGIGIYETAKDLGDYGKEVWVIGSETDQALEYPKFEKVILSSMVKRVDNAVYSSVEKENEGNSYKGKVIEMGIQDKGVAIATSTSKNTPKEIIELVNRYEKAIKEGKIKVPSTLEELQGFEEVKLEE